MFHELTIQALNLLADTKWRTPKDLNILPCGCSAKANTVVRQTRQI